MNIQDEHTEIISNAFVSGFRPIERLTVSEWANKNRILTSMSSAEPGPYRYQKTPYLRKIMDNLGSSSDVKEVIVMKGAQVGFTDAGNNWIGYTIDIDPGPMLVVMPTEGAIKKNSRTRIKPMIDSTPVLKSKIKPAGSKEAGNTVTEKEFPGGVLMMVAAHSPVGLSSTPVRKLFLDEVDRYPASAGNEGSPVELARARVRAFWNSILFMISTPTNEGESIIAKEFESGDCQYYNVPCIYCGELFVIIWDYITWEKGKPETTRCACPNCGGLHEERHKTIMLAEKGYSPEGLAEWIATKESSDPKKESFHLSGLYSPYGFYSWEQAVRDYLKAENDENLMRTWINTVKGETVKITGEVLDPETLYGRREGYKTNIVPDEVYFLTMGVDVQKDRLECEIVGWCLGRSSYSIDYRVLLGDPDKPEVWESLREIINNQFECLNGDIMPITLTAIDAAYKTETVYNFTAKFPRTKVIPVMGRRSVKDIMVSPPRATTVNKAGKKIEGHKVWYLGTSLLKSELYGFLKIKSLEIDGNVVYPEGYCHFPEYDMHYFEMLTAEEQRMSIDKKGFAVYEWHKKTARNEALDIRCYARAAAYVLGIDRFKKENFEKLRVVGKKIADGPVSKIEKPKKRSSFWDKK